MINIRALLLASLPGIVLQIAMVVAVADARTTRSVACETSIGLQGHIVRPGAPSVAMILSGMPAAQDTSPVVSEVVIEAPVDEVWKTWATSDGLRSWLAPHAEIDMRVGGRMRTNYSAKGTLGDSQTIENTILSLDPGRMLSIRVSRAPDGLPFANALQHMWTVIYFEPVGPDRTRVRVVGLGFRPDAESQQMRGFFEQGNAATLKLLQRHFTTKPC